MKVNLQEINFNISYPKELEALEYFKQFNIYKTVSCKADTYCNDCRYYDNCFSEKNMFDNNILMCNLEYTTPTLRIISTKIISTLEGTSLEGEHLCGKKLIIVGDINLSIIFTYLTELNQCRKTITEVEIPFSIFLVIPKETCNEEVLNLGYLIEDVSVVYLENCNAIVSITILIQYLDEA